ncbi:hypothetical protein [Stenotrophomonas pigmentata]|uniref:hypothetical protein n=1 Tax=Stenotrophomonas pigmentata TaxID=3055080 RepID=UPI0026F0B855|nr:hypothetical protein [Stenotrophomonas sp. 610A2]
MAAQAGDTIYDERRAPLTLGKLLKSGGAGSVFLIKERPLEVAKLYHSDKGGQVYERKVRAMLELRPDLPDVEDKGVRQVQIAWPTGLLRDKARRFIGFTMPVLDVAATSDLEHVLQERQAREEGLPTALGPKMTLAANLAVMLAALHERQHYVVDLKPLNVRFYRKSLFIAMLDCDGFSIQGKGERFLSEQVTTDYLAAEFQQRGVASGEEEAQDRFALAVMVFQLLNSGLHPYSGRPNGSTLPSDLPGRIAANLYPYGVAKNESRILPSPVSGHEAFPADLREMFDRAFASQARRRPAAAEWSSLLLRYARRSNGLLVKCASDGTHQHFSGMPCAACARAALLKRSARATQTRVKQAAAGGKRTARAARRTHVATPNVAAAQNAAAPAAASTPAGLGMRVFFAVIGPLLLGWAFSWGMSAYRGFQLAKDPGWWLTLGLGFQSGLLLAAVLLFIVCVPVLILSKRP